LIEVTFNYQKVEAHIISYQSAGKTYYVSEENTDCPIQEIIKTESECIVAAAQQGLKYHSEVTRTTIPAGCYTWLHAGSKVAHFNNVLDPSSTTPSYKAAGICRSGSIG
jgi:hypothetical protein